MLSIKIHINEVVESLEGIGQRLGNQRLFFRQVVRPRLLDEFAAAYRQAGVRVRTGRLLESYTALVSGDQVSEISEDRIVQGSRVPYAVFVERLLPIAGRVAKNQRLLNEFTEQLGEFIVNENAR